MSKVQAPELKKYMDKLLFVNLQGNRKISGYLRGFDIFLNLVLDEAREEGGADKVECGTVVVRGNSISSMELMASRA
ncbi:small nuclear ribonucleoprotein G [Rhodotorula toruloides]|uniref:Small nuclear ribonucleoprotein G n=1 Tax=Rhodotorula toruloides TaxID=5286 RepID=A0A511K889_RHOTO|nr:small nuclear ribonucleoprotein G [Rhodotorula toruloides]